MSFGHNKGTGDFGGEQTTRLYQLKKHGVDGAILLDPHIRRVMLEDWANHDAPTERRRLADIGGGSGWLSVFAAGAGFEVSYSELNSSFVAQAEQAKSENNLDFDVAAADCRSLPYTDGQFSFALSSNVGCALDADGLVEHVNEAARILQPGGQMLLTAPSSLEHVFTTEGASFGIQTQFEQSLRGVKTIEDLRELVRRETRIHRATLFFEPGENDVDCVKLVLKNLRDGTPVFRVISGSILVPNFFHQRQDCGQTARC